MKRTLQLYAKVRLVNYTHLFEEKKKQCLIYTLQNLIYIRSGHWTIKIN